MMKKLKRSAPALVLMVLVLVLVGSLLFGQLCWAAVSGILILLIPGSELLRYGKENQNPLSIRTPDGSDQPYHPSVVRLEEPICGYRYWMAFTPFPIGAKPYRDRWEYPCVVASNDGVRWEYPEGKVEPLDDLTEDEIARKDYFSDTELLFNRGKDRLECYYRLSNGALPKEDVSVFRRVSNDGVRWSTRQEVQLQSITVPNGSPVISPAILLEDGQYHMWYVLENGGKMRIGRSHSEDGLVWQEHIPCTLSGREANPWHIDCKYYEDTYWLVIYEFSQVVTLWKSKDGTHFTFERELLRASGKIGSFYRTGLYRSCLLQDQEEYKLYFSAGNERRVSVGIMRGKNLASLQVFSPEKGYSMEDFRKDFYEKYTFPQRWLIWKIRKKLNCEVQPWF